MCAVYSASDRELALLTPTMYFGELALLRNEVSLAFAHRHV